MQLQKRITIALCSLMLCAYGGNAAEYSSEYSEDMYPLHFEITFETDDLESDAPARGIEIKLTGSSANCENGGVEITGNTITITRGGDYIVSGTLNDGMLIVHVGKEDTVRITLANAEIHSSSSAAIYVRNARKVIITAAEDTENRLSNDGEYNCIDDNNIDSVIFSKDDLSINGNGRIIIDAICGHGIVSKDSLRISDVRLSISAADHAISANDDIGISGGEYLLQSGKDGIHAENNDIDELGNVLILDGQFEIESDGDGISAQNILEIDGGSYDILCGGGHTSAERSNEPFPPFNRSGAETAENAVSSKALKSGSDSFICGGNYQLNTCDDALHSNANLHILSGNFNINTDDDALHVEQALAVYGGNISIESSYEGIEAYTVDIAGGSISLTSSDDGINAAGENDISDMDFQRNNPFASDPNAYIHISNGNITIRCGGDGIDSNGEIRISGGNIVVSGPINGGNSSIDSGVGAYIDGGKFIATGSAQMAEHFNEESGQCSLAIATVGESGALISVRNASDEELYTHTAECSFDYLLLSLPDFEIGESYRLFVDDTETEFSFESTLYSDGNTGAFGGINGKDFHKGDRDHAEPPNVMTPPDGMHLPTDKTSPNGAQFSDNMTPPDSTSFQDKKQQ